ncbi:MAG: stage II sporulation protein P [Syntrophomonadaceae bacterium]|nr:stage II sporulation protein P [Syntrophomonadaceae bacterium]
MNRWWRTGIILAMTLLLTMTASSFALAVPQEDPSANAYYTLLDENNNVIHQTGTKVYVGDEYISAGNSRYKVTEITGETARCIYQGQEEMPVLQYDQKQSAWIFNQAIPAAASKKPTIAVYHTHSDESYVPSDGKESIEGNGGIYDVGEVMVKKLKTMGFNVQYSENNHNPHDVNAYNRSRRTAASLLKKSQPDAILDVHRDAVPASQYQAQVKGTDVTKIKLVVGRSNPNMKTNMEFAKKIKAVMDKKAPGLSNGIYIGKGDYNQDLSSRAMLIEVGAHTNKKEDAEKGVSLFAETLPSVLGISLNNNTSSTSPAKKPLSTGDNQGAGSTILILLVVVAAAAGGYYLLNKGTNK